MKPILEVAYLTDDHGSTLENCPGCKICDRITELMKDIDGIPHVKYKHLLDKGEDLTVSEIIYLNGKDVLKSKIRQATGLTKKGLKELLLKGESLDKKSIKAVDEMGAITKFNMTKEKAEQLKAEGKKKSEIAKIAGVTLSTYIHHEKKWNGDQPKKVAANEEYDALLQQLKEQVEQKDGTIEKLEKKIGQLEQDKLDLHAAADDTAREYLEKEEKLLIDLSLREQQALTYKAENGRLNNNLSEVRQDLAKYKGENVLAKAFIKAVL